MENIEKEQAELLEKQKQEALQNVKKAAEDAAQNAVQELIDKKMSEIVSKFDKVMTKEEVEVLKADFYKQVQELQARIKQVKQTGACEKSIKNIYDVISNTIEESAETLKSFRGKEKLVLKAITDASWIPADALSRQTTEVRTSLYNSPYSPLYLRNIFPNVTTDQASVVIPQAGAITGGAGVWERGAGTTPKPEINPTYTDITVPMKWIAGFATVNRELLLNVGYLQSSITNTLLYSRNGLFAAENNMIISYITTNAPDYVTDFGGSMTIGVEMILDAAFNLLLGNYMNPTHVLMNPADYLAYIKLNKAAGSGEYDLPNDLLRGFAGTGLEVAVQVVPVPTLAAGTAYVVSAPEFEFISRLAPELMVSEEHADNFAYNKVSFRVEEMVGFVAKDLNAMVKIGLPPIIPPTGA